MKFEIARKIYLMIVYTSHVQKSIIVFLDCQGSVGKLKGNLRINLMQFNITVVYGQSLIHTALVLSTGFLTVLHDLTY